VDETRITNFDELTKNHKIPFSVIPAKAGIQSFRLVAENIGSSRTRSGICRSDDFCEFINFEPKKYENY
jgi:hypothetical protein